MTTIAMTQTTAMLGVSEVSGHHYAYRTTWARGKRQMGHCRPPCNPAPSENYFQVHDYRR